jgi:predicted alpha-1,2-mannosidase
MEALLMLDYIDPFIGVDERGNCLCGPYLPFSLVRLGPDTLPPQPTNGYRSTSPIIYFSHTHVSGTGGGSRYGNIGVMPFTGQTRLLVEASERSQEMASPGYYTTVLMSSGVRVELTSTPRVGVHRYHFPENSQANILINAGAIIRPATIERELGTVIGGFVEWISDTEVVGRADCKGGWGHHFPYSVYFYAQFSVPAVQRIVANVAGIVEGPVATTTQCQAVAGFGQQQVIEARFGISYVSVAKARASVVRETQRKTFETIHDEARATWERALSRISVEGGTREQTTLFYTLFTRLLCMPSDLGIDDEFPSWHSGGRQFTDIYCLWDSVRNANALLSLFDPQMEAELLNSLLDIADHVGWLPDAWIAGHAAQIQGGSSADILFCEAALKGITGIDYEKALRYMRKNNEVESPDPWLYGRYVADYRDLGYVSTYVKTACVSRHLEYSYQDWCTGRLAEQLGHHTIAHMYFQHAHRLWKLWREDLHAFAPRSADGTWISPFDPNEVGGPFDPFFYEAASCHWSFQTFHDFAGLIERHGGSEAFLQHLDRFFDEGRYRSKEMMLHVPFLYHYVGRPDKSSARVHALRKLYFHARRAGLPDNEDMGCQSAWYICSTIGMYPIMGQDLYLLIAPTFTRTVVALGSSGNSLIIEAPEVGENYIYVKAMKLNGKPLHRAWIRHHEIAKGGVLHFTLDTSPGEWGTRELPPSPMHI